jgi:hypothetical protein
MVDPMVWFFTRNQQSLAVETRYDKATDEFVGIVTGLGGPAVTKRFSTPEAFRTWLAALERDLVADRWTPDGRPHILPDGWRETPWVL